MYDYYDYYDYYDDYDDLNFSCFGYFNYLDQYCLNHCPYSFRCEDYTYSYNDDWWW